MLELCLRVKRVKLKRNCNARVSKKSREREGEGEEEHEWAEAVCSGADQVQHEGQTAFPYLSSFGSILLAES